MKGYRRILTHRVFRNHGDIEYEVSAACPWGTVDEREHLKIISNPAGLMQQICLYMVLVFLMSGCASEYAPIYTAGVNAMGENVTDVSGYVKDASISKESAVHATLQTMYKEYTKAHKQSGLKVDFAMMDLAPGVKAYLPTSVEYRDEPEYDTLVKAPTAPSEHPVWHTVDNVVDKGLWLGLGWVFGDALKSMSSGTHYENSKFDNSFNGSGGGDQMFNIDSPSTCPTGDCGGEVGECGPDGLIIGEPDCSCESRLAGRC